MLICILTKNVITSCSVTMMFFFQAEDGIRDLIVTGVQTCALLISSRRRHTRSDRDWSSDVCSSDLPYTTAFPLIVPGALMIEPTESESREECDLFIDAMKSIAEDRKSTRLNSSHDQISYAVFCLKKKKDTDSELSYGHMIVARAQFR